VFGRHGSRALLDQRHRPGRGGQVSDANPVDIKGQWHEVVLYHFFLSSITSKDLILSSVLQEGQLGGELRETRNALSVLS
jgi:hypothetical protein